MTRCTRTRPIWLWTQGKCTGRCQIDMATVKASFTTSPLADISVFSRDARSERHSFGGISRSRCSHQGVFWLSWQLSIVVGLGLPEDKYILILDQLGKSMLDAELGNNRPELAQRLYIKHLSFTPSVMAYTFVGYTRRTKFHHS